MRTLTATDLYTTRCHGMNDPVYKRMAAVIDHVFILLSLAHVCLSHLQDDCAIHETAYLELKSINQPKSVLRIKSTVRSFVLHADCTEVVLRIELKMICFHSGL